MRDHWCTVWIEDAVGQKLHPRMRRKLGLQCSNGITCLIFLPKSNDGIGDEQHHDDDEIGPMVDNAGKDRRRLNHPGDGSPEVREKFEERVGRFLGDLVRTVLGQPRLSFRLAVPTTPSFSSSLSSARLARSDWCWLLDAACAMSALSSSLPARAAVQSNLPHAAKMLHASLAFATDLLGMKPLRQY